MKKKLTSKEVNHIVLAVEAVLIIASLLSSGKAVIGMSCYWGLVAFYHLTDFLYGRFSDGEE